MILVGVGDNYPDLFLALIGSNPDWEGNLTFIFLSNPLAPRNPETCRYRFLLISREGVKSINGKPIQSG
jgi:hypothetical protein